MRPLVNFYHWRGINDKISPRDIPATSLVECENWEVDNVRGYLKLAKGWEEKFTTPLSADADGIIDYYIVRDGSQRMIIVRDSDNRLLVIEYVGAGIWKVPVVLNASTINSLFSKFDATEFNGDAFSGCGSGDTNISWWYGYIDRERFWDGLGLFQQNLNGYYYKVEQLGKAIQSNANVAWTSNVTPQNVLPAGAATEFPDLTTYEFALTLMYDGYQESPLYADDDLRVHPNALSSFVTGTANTFDSVWFNLDVVSGISERVTAVNVYMREVKPVYRAGFGWKGVGVHELGEINFEWRLVKTVYLDDTKTAKRIYNDPAVFLDASYEKWIDNTTYYRYEPGQYSVSPESLFISYDEYLNAPARIDVLGFGDTNRITPNYSQNIMFKNVRYVANARYPKISFEPPGGVGAGDEVINWNDGDYLPNVVYFSPPSQPNVLPITNFIVTPESVTGLGASNSELLIFSENFLSIYDEYRSLKGEWAKDGCISHQSISNYNGQVFWAGKSRIQKYDRFYPEDISTFKIQELYNAIPLEDKRNSYGAIDTKKKEYILAIPNYGVLRYAIDTGEWTVKTGHDLVTLYEGTENDIVGVTGGSFRKIINYDKTYSHSGSYYTATALTKKYAGTNLDAVIKSLTLGYASYTSQDDIIVKIIVDNVVASTITLSPATVDKVYQFDPGGLNGEYFQLEISVTTSASTEDTFLDFIKLFGDINDLVGAVN